MNKEKAKLEIERAINLANGIKSIELATKLAAMKSLRIFESSDILEFINELIAEKRIVELEFVTPNLPNRIKSIYFPIGTEFSFKQAFSKE